MAIPTVFVRNPYNYDVDKVSNETGLSCGEPSLAQQSMADECDINNIVRRFGLTGELPSNVRLPQYADLSDMPSDYLQALNLVTEAESAFSQMPAELRARLNNDPALFLEWVANPANRDEARKHGLLNPEVSVSLSESSEAPARPSET